METQFKTRINARQKVEEIYAGETLTIPDQSHSMREILERYSRGIMPRTQAEPVYNENHEYPDLDKLDLVDIQHIKENLNNRIDEKNTTLADLRKKVIKQREESQSPSQKDDANNQSQPSEPIV